MANYSHADASQIVLVQADQTCPACPSQWDAWDAADKYYYLRYRFGCGQVCPDDAGNVPVIVFEHGDPLDGVISLEEFCQLAGIRLNL